MSRGSVGIQEVTRAVSDQNLARKICLLWISVRYYRESIGIQEAARSVSDPNLARDICLLWISVRHFQSHSDSI